MTKNDKLNFNPLLHGDSEAIAARLVRILDEPAFSFPGARIAAPNAIPESKASEQAVIQEQI